MPADQVSPSHSGVHFGESLVVRLYSEIDHIHLSSEAQCVSHHLPQVDCHKGGNKRCTDFEGGGKILVHVVRGGQILIRARKRDNPPAHKL